MFREMSPVTGNLLGQQLRSAGTFVWLTQQLTADVPSKHAARPPSVAAGAENTRKM